MSESEIPFRLLYFRADWCGVCHEKSPVVEEIAASAGLRLPGWISGWRRRASVRCA